MQRLEVSGAVRPIYESLGVKTLRSKKVIFIQTVLTTPKCGSDVKKCIQNWATEPKRSN